MKNNPTPSDTYKVTLERLAHSGLRADQFTCARRLVANALQPLAWREFLTTARLKAPTGPDIFGVQQEIELLFFIRPDELQPDCEINFCDGYVSLKLTTLEGVELSGNVPVGREDVDPLDTPQQVKPEWMQFFIAHDSTLYSFSRLDTIPEARAVEIVTAIGSEQNPHLRQDLQAGPPAPFDMARVLGVQNKKLELHGIRFRSRTGTPVTVIPKN